MSEVGGYRRTDPDTSVIAAEGVDVGSWEARVLGTMDGREGEYHPFGMTTGEIASFFPDHPKALQSITPRMKQLEKKGLVHRTKYRRDGRIVWRLGKYHDSDCGEKLT